MLTLFICYTTGFFMCYKRFNLTFKSLWRFGYQFSCSHGPQLYVPPGTSVVCSHGVEAGLPSMVLTVADVPFTGYLRLALSNNCTTGHVPPSPHCAKEVHSNFLTSSVL